MTNSWGSFAYGAEEWAGPPVANSPYVAVNRGLFPYRIIEMAFGNGPNDTAPTWIDVTNDVNQFSTRRGRQHTLSRFEAGTIDVLLDNKSGKYSPFNGSGPYSGQIRPGMPVRVRAIWGAITYPVFYGFVETWPLTWPSANDAMVSVSAVDSMKWLNLKKAGAINSYPAVILADAPWGWWRLNDPVGPPTFVDSSGNGHDMTVAQWNEVGLAVTSPVTAHGQAEPLLTADPTASTYFGHHEVAGRTAGVGIGGGAVSLPTTLTFEVWVRLAVGDQSRFLTTQYASARQMRLGYDGSNLTWTGPATVIGPSLSTGQTYHIVGTMTADADPIMTLYVNGAQVAQTQATAGWGGGSLGEAVVGGENSLTGNVPHGYGDGWIQEAAVYTYVLSQAQIFNHWNAGAYPRQLETTGARVSYLASYTGMPGAMQRIDTGTVAVQGATDTWLTGSILKNMQDQEETENGALFIDAAGNLTFFDGNHINLAPYSSVSLILGDSGAAPEEPYRLDGLVVPYDDQDVWNEVVVTPANLTPQTASDGTSQTAYGIRTKSAGTLHYYAADAATLATTLLNAYKTPAPRVDSVKIVPTDDANMLFGPVLGFDLLTKVEVRRRPLDGTSSVFDQTFYIEGIEHRVTKATWETTWRLSTIAT